MIHQSSIKSYLPPRATRGGHVSVRGRGDTTELVIFGEIGNDGVKPADVRAKLAGATGTVVAHINSPGGDFFDGLTIHNTLRERGNIRVVIDGLAASAASIIAMAGDEIGMAQGAFLMVHEAWSLAVGPASEMRAVADVLDKISGEIAGIYANRTGQDRSKIAQMMAIETWLTAEEAVDQGFADTIAKTEASFSAADLSVYRNAPRIPVAPPAPDKRTAEASLRQAGLSRRKAAALVAAGWPAIIDPATDLEPLRDLAAELRKGSHHG